MIGDLARLVAAQDRIWPVVIAELEAGRKEIHRMGFVFPQIRGHGRSETARPYGIADEAEARAHAAHPVLGPRLVAAAAALLAHPELSAEAILGPVDAAKLRSCATLLAAAEEGRVRAVMDAVLGRFFAGARCPATLAASDGGTGRE